MLRRLREEEANGFRREWRTMKEKKAQDPKQRQFNLQKATEAPKSGHWPL